MLKKKEPVPEVGQKRKRSQLDEKPTATGSGDEGGVKVTRKTGSPAPEGFEEQGYLKKFKSESLAETECPFLDTINRKLLDFDLEKKCCVTLKPHNVYICLVCGKYFEGRAEGTPAHRHALDTGHRMFMKMTGTGKTGTIWWLPVNTQVTDPSLRDIQHNLDPTYTKPQVKVVDKTAEYSHGLDGTDYLPGVIGMNDLSRTSWFNAVIQALVRVRPLRSFFLDESNYEGVESPVVRFFGQLVRKMFNPRAYKGQVSPHELLDAIMIASDRKFQVGQNADPLQFLSWLINTLHKDLGGGKRRNSSIISRTFQGRVKVVTEEPRNKKLLRELSGMDPSKLVRGEMESVQSSVRFFYLALELPQMPLFKDGDNPEAALAQIPLAELLDKFNGVKSTLGRRGLAKQHVLTYLPPYLIVAFKRYKEIHYGVIEKNNTIVNFGIKNLDMLPYFRQTKADQDIRSKYDLIDNIVHTGTGNSGKKGAKISKGTSIAYVFNRANNQWYKMEDLTVDETIPQLVAVAESYVQVWKRR